MIYYDQKYKRRVCYCVDKILVEDFLKTSLMLIIDAKIKDCRVKNMLE